MRRKQPMPATVALSVDVGGACVSVESVPWGDAERVMIALVALMDGVRARSPSLRHIVDVVPGGSPVDVPEDGWGARRMGF